MSCPACNATSAQTLWEVGDRLFQTTAERFHIRRCSACGLLFLSPMPSPAQLSRYYPEAYWTAPGKGADVGGLRRRLGELYRRMALFDHVRFVQRIIAEQKRAGKSVALLDVGCADGSFLAAFGSQHRVGLDNSWTAVRAARARGLNVLQGSLLTCALAENSFSLITMFHFLEHVRPAGSYLRAARRLLTDDGDLVVQVPNAASWQAALLKAKWSGFDVPRHLVNYSTGTLRVALAEAGFRVVREEQFSLRDNAAALANSLAPGLYPPARAVRRKANRGLLAWAADLAYLGLILLFFPFTAVESLFGRGATVMVQAKKVQEGA